MSHLLIVQSNDYLAGRRVYEQGLATFNHVHHLSPIGQINTRSTRLALFPRTLSTTPAIVRTSNGHICGNGTWFYRGTSGEEGLRRLASDTSLFEVALEECLGELDGWFTITGLRANGDVHLITDRLGQFQMYTVRAHRCLLISTSSLVLAALSQASWDTLGCRQFLATGVIFEPSRTLFENVEKLKPASVYTFTKGRSRSTKYWDLASVLQRRADSPGDVLELADALCDAVTTISRNFVRPVFDLTGGFDTRGILGAVLQAGLQPEFVVNGAPNDADVLTSKHIAREFGLKHQHFWSGFSSAAQWWERAKESLALVDGEQDVLYYANTLQAHSQLARTFDASVNGNVGEICQGHWWELCFPHVGSHHGLDPRVIASRRLAGGESEIPGLLACDFSEELVEYFTEIVRQQNANLNGSPNTAYMDNIYLSLWEQRFYGRTVSASSHLWPVLSPYGFRAPLEASLTVPWQDRVFRRLSRRLIDHYSAKLAALPTSNGGPASPLHLSNALSFLPLAQSYVPLVARRIASGLGVSAHSEKNPLNNNGSGESIFDRLCRLEEVRELTDPRVMVTAELYNVARLRAVLAERPRPRYSPTAWPGRILTLELLGRQRKEAVEFATACEIARTYYAEPATIESCQVLTLSSV
jgi:hypothetical protein